MKHLVKTFKNLHAKVNYLTELLMLHLFFSFACKWLEK